MNICVLGLWHLGSTTAACCARHFSVVGLDFDGANITRLNRGEAPIFEPGLNELIAAGLDSRKLKFTTDPKTACAKADVLWLTYDTPVNDDDESDVEYVLTNLRLALHELPKGALIVISSQLPVGTCKKLEKEFPCFHFAYSPENLRLGRAIDAFENADRAIVGIRDEVKRTILEKLFKRFAAQTIFMRTESAEMVKHALNAFLGLSITFINEIGSLCEHLGADAKEVSIGLKSEARIGPRAYLGAGGPFAGGTLARDVVTLTKIADEVGETISVIPSIKVSNDLHRGWAYSRLRSLLGDLSGKKIVVLGLTYTPNTDTLRRSASVELCRQLVADRAMVVAFDPIVKSLPVDLVSISLAEDITEAILDAEAVVVCTEWPQFRKADWTKLVFLMRQQVFVDANRFLEDELKSIPEVEHLSVGRA
jgi:UDPglucose 6-dehydrogenase